MPEIDMKQAVTDLTTAFTEFREANDAALKSKLGKEDVDPLVDSKLEKANEAISDIMARVEEAEREKDALKAAIERAAYAPQSKDGGMTPEEKAAYFATVTGAKDALGADELDAYRAGLKSYYRRGDAVAAETLKALQVGRDSDGGFVVEPDSDGRIIQKIHETSPMRQLADVQTIGNDAMEGLLDLDEPETGWVGETSDRPQTGTPQLGMWRIPVHEQYAFPLITQKMLDDAMMDVEGWLEGKLGRKLGRGENVAFTKGDGVKRPRGFLTYPAGVPAKGDWNVVERFKTERAGQFAESDPGDVMVGAIYGLKEEYRANSTWTMNRTTEAAVRKLKDGQGNYLWQPDFALRNGRAILGAPVVNFEDMPNIADGSLAIAVGDFEAGYQIVDRVGIRVLRDPYTHKGFVGFYTTKRTGGGVINTEALKLIEFSA